MNRKIITCFVAVSLLFLIGCTPKQIVPVFKRCENTFTLSDHRKIYLFEHDAKSVRFRLLKQYEDWGSNGSFLDCQRNIIVSPYSGKGIAHDTGGVMIFNLNNDSSKNYEIYEDVNGAIEKYKNGILLNTKLIQSDEINKDSGYIQPEEMHIDEGKRWKVYEYTHFFDLDQRKVLQSYKTIVFTTFIKGDIMIAVQGSSIIKINLTTGQIKAVFEPISYEERMTRVWIPMHSFGLFSGEDYYNIPTSRSYNEFSGEDKLVGYEKGALYKLENEKMIKQVNLPYKDVTYAVSPDEYIYIFTKSLKKVMRFHTKTKQLSEYTLKLPMPDDWHIESVGYTNDNFIIPVDQDGYENGGVFVVNRDFSKISDIYAFQGALISVTTERDIKTNSGRTID